MNPLTPSPGRRTSPVEAGLRMPTPPQGWVVGSYPDYARAQAAVEHLTDHDFPVGDVTIVGVDLMQVERVIGRLTWPRVLSGGLVSGVWLGLFMGLLLGFLGSPLAGALALGAAMGAVFGVVTAALPYAATRGRRDFSTTMELVARRYDILCDPSSAERARDALEKLGDAPETAR